MRYPVTARRRVLAVAAAALAILAAAPAARADPAVPRVYDDDWNWDHPELVRASLDETFARTPYDHEWMTDSYYFLAILDSGWIVLTSHFQWTYGVFGSWGLNVIAVDPAGKVFSYDGKLGNGKPKAAPAGMDIRAGDTYFVADGGRFRWHIEVPDFSCDFTFTNVLPPWKPGDGVALISDNGRIYSHYALPAPWATLSGTLTALGTTVDATGQCILDSSETVLPPARANPEILSFRVFSPPGTPPQDRWMLSHLTTVTHPAYGPLRLPMLLLARGGAWVLTAKEFTVEPIEWGAIDDPPYPYPTAYRVEARKQGVTLSGTLRCDRPYYVTDIFARLPSLFRAIATLFFRRPVIYRNRASFDGTVTSPDGTVTPLWLPGQSEYAVTK